MWMKKERSNITMLIEIMSDYECFKKLLESRSKFITYKSVFC